MRALIEGAVLVVVWFLTAWCIEAVASDSPAREAYGTLSAWWATLYVANLLQVTLRRGGLIGGMAVVVCLALRLAGWEWGHDSPSSHDVSGIVGLCLLQALVFVSPILVNAIVGATVRRAAKARTGG